jgi:hypothetical protein
MVPPETVKTFLTEFALRYPNLRFDRPWQFEPPASAFSFYPNKGLLQVIHKHESLSQPSNHSAFFFAGRAQGPA